MKRPQLAVRTIKRHKKGSRGRWPWPGITDVTSSGRELARGPQAAKETPLRPSLPRASTNSPAMHRPPVAWVGTPCPAPEPCRHTAVHEPARRAQPPGSAAPAWLSGQARAQPRPSQATAGAPKHPPPQSPAWSCGALSHTQTAPGLVRLRPSHRGGDKSQECQLLQDGALEGCWCGFPGHVEG